MADPNDMASAAERLLRSYQASAAGYGQVQGNLSLVQQQQQQAAAALQSAQLAAAAYSNPMALSSFYNPYAAMYAFGGGGTNPFAGGGMGWPGAMMSPDYMMRLAALQQQQQIQQHQQQQQQAQTQAALTPTTESFSDILKKIQPPHSSKRTRDSQKSPLDSVEDSRITPGTIFEQGKAAALPGKPVAGDPNSSPNISNSSVISAGSTGRDSAGAQMDNNDGSNLAAGASTSGIKKDCFSPETGGGSGSPAEFSSLETLAAVATSLKTQDKTNAEKSSSDESLLSGGENGAQELRAHSDTDPSTCASRAASTSTSASRGRSPLEGGPGGDLTLPPKKRRRREDYDALSPSEDREGMKRSKPDEEGGDPSGAPGGLGNLSSDIQMDPKLLNASAMAWAALSNQIYLGMQMGMLKQLTEQQGGNFPSGEDQTTSSGAKRRVLPQGRGRPATISAEEMQSPVRDHMDDTIESVIRQHCHGNGKDAQVSTYTKQPARRVGRPSKRTGMAPRKIPMESMGLTVREQLELKRVQEPSREETEGVKKEEQSGSHEALPLDLSTKPLLKKEEITSLVKSEAPESSPDSMEASRPSSSDRSTESPSYPRRRKIPDEDLIRAPLEQGWRRQTCIRTISANGVRGDVIYYAPCGKRLGSYAEVIRGIVKLGENDVMEIIEKMGDRSGCSVHESQMRRSNRNRGSSAVGRLSEVTIQQRQLLKAMEMRKADRDKESQLRAQRILDAMRRAKEQEVKKHHISLLQKQAKQEEQYYRQMLLMGLEREKMRQQVLAAKAMESRKKQEERQRIIAERLIRQEEKVAARTAHQLRIKQLRQPIDDLDLKDGKALPDVQRIQGLKLEGKAFADLLMVMEFLKNFGGVLKIDMKDVPSMSDVHAGLMKSPCHMKFVRKLAKILLTLVLEYPGLPPGTQSKTFLNQAVRELKITRDNMSELLRMFLDSREDSEGLRLGKLVVGRSFDALTAREKAEILAYMCNELLYCRNVVREIEGNIEDTTRMKGERWLRETKMRTLRSLQAKKRVDQQREARESPVEVPEKEEDRQSPTSLSGASESEAELKSLAEVKREQETTATPEKKQKIFTESTESQRSSAGTPVKKVPMTPGTVGPETITEEEKGMSVEGLEEVIGSLGKEAEELMEKIADKTCRVRAQPYGQDRFHRFYWVLPNLGGVFLESIESGRINNPGCLIKESQLSSTRRESEVKRCVGDLVEEVCRKEDHQPLLDLSPKNAEAGLAKGAFVSLLPEEMQEGWWEVKSKEEFHQIMSSLQFRGIRERVLHRNLTRYSTYVKKQSFLRTNPIALDKVEGKCLSEREVEVSCLLRVLNAVKLLEEKVFHANIHVRQWKPPESDSLAQGGSEEREEGEEEWSKSSSSSSLSGGGTTETPPDLPRPPLFPLIKERLLKLERNIERRYLASPFHHCRSVPAEVILNGETSTDCDRPAPVKRDFQPIPSQETPTTSDNAWAEVSGRSDEAPAELEKWRSGIEGATNASQLMLCVLQMDANVAWEKSIMRASCQICQSGDNESKLLLCDGCDMGYHTYCFKPKMETIPAGDWFCPDCISRATDQECCLLCCKQGGKFALCSECGHSFHPLCLDIETEPPSLSEPSRDVGTPLKKRSSSSSLPSTPVSPLVPWNSASWKCPACSKEEGRGRTEEAQTPESGGKPPVKKGKKKKLNNKETKSKTHPEETLTRLSVEELCSIMLAELDAHKDSWPFKLPVDMKAFPLYKKVIRKPMDLSCIKSKLHSHKYEMENEFSDDVKLIFGNCKTFNEDDSPVGKAGR